MDELCHHNPACLYKSNNLRHKDTQCQISKCITSKTMIIIKKYIYISIPMKIILVPEDSSICLLSNTICILLFSPARCTKDTSLSEKIPWPISTLIFIYFYACVVRVCIELFGNLFFPRIMMG